MIELNGQSTSVRVIPVGTRKSDGANFASFSSCMSSVLFEWSSETQGSGTQDPVWDGVKNSTLEPSLHEALDWFSLPSTPALEDAIDLNLLQHEINVHAEAQPSGADSAWNIPSTSPLETARSAPDEPQAAPATSDSFLDFASPGEEGQRQPGGTQSRYTTERKLAKNREAQRRFRQRHKVM